MACKKDNIRLKQKKCISDLVCGQDDDKMTQTAHDAFFTMRSNDFRYGFLKNCDSTKNWVSVLGIKMFNRPITTANRVRSISTRRFAFAIICRKFEIF